MTILVLRDVKYLVGNDDFLLLILRHRQHPEVRHAPCPVSACLHLPEPLLIARGYLERLVRTGIYPLRPVQLLPGRQGTKYG